jgi:hypothetical protein
MPSKALLRLVGPIHDELILSCIGSSIDVFLVQNLEGDLICPDIKPEGDLICPDIVTSFPFLHCCLWDESTLTPQPA